MNFFDRYVIISLSTSFLSFTISFLPVLVILTAIIADFILFPLTVFHILHWLLISSLFLISFNLVLFDPSTCYINVVIKDSLHSHACFFITMYSSLLYWSSPQFLRKITFLWKYFHGILQFYLSYKISQVCIHLIFLPFHYFPRYCAICFHCQTWVVRYL